VVLIATILASNSANLDFQLFLSPSVALVFFSFSFPLALAHLLPIGFKSG
jgi:hypothetical protein